MLRKLELWILLAAACRLAMPAELRAEQPAAAPAKADAVESAIKRAAEMSDHASALADEATKQRAALEAVRALHAVENRELSAALAAKTKDADDARAQLSALQKEIATLRATVAERTSVVARENETKQKLDAKDAEIATLRAELAKLQGTIAQERQEREKAQVATKRLADDKQALEAKLAERAASPGTAAVVAKQEPASAPAPADESVNAPPEGAVKKWQKPDGSLFFGERPPPGSKLLGYTTGGGL